jgi:dsDNA-specific endonuclease/ATPase MutS2
MAHLKNKKKPKIVFPAAQSAGGSGSAVILAGK